MGIINNLSNGLNFYTGTSTNGAPDLDTLLGKVAAITSGTSLPLPSTQVRKRLAATGKFLEVKHSTTGPLQKDDPRSLVHNIKYVGKIHFVLNTEVKSCSSAHDIYKEKVQARETTLFSFQDAAGNTGFMIRHGNNAVVLTDAKTRKEARRMLDASFLPNYVGSDAWYSEHQDLGFSSPLRSVVDAVTRASFPVRQSFIQESGCGGGC